VFARRCSRCHTLARPLNAQIRDPQHWVRYVTRMRRNPGSGINPQDAELILNFLLFYTAQREKDERAAEQPPQRDPEPRPGTAPASVDEPAAPDPSTNDEPPPAPAAGQDSAGATQSTGPAADPSTDEPGATPPAAPPSEDALP
jgi:hypothetical protein